MSRCRPQMNSAMPHHRNLGEYSMRVDGDKEKKKETGSGNETRNGFIITVPPNGYRKHMVESSPIAANCPSQRNFPQNEVWPYLQLFKLDGQSNTVAIYCTKSAPQLAPTEPRVGFAGDP